MGQSFGLEHVLWFANNPEDAYEDPTFERNRSHDYVAREVEAVRHGVGGIEIANFAKHVIKGKGARAWLDKTMAGFVPQRTYQPHAYVNRKRAIIWRFDCGLP